jgi:hypothetical protein
MVQGINAYWGREGFFRRHEKYLDKREIEAQKT